MRIIKPGQLPSEKTYRATCGVCSCVFEAARKDATKDLPGDVREPPSLMFNCPTCTMRIWVPT